MSNLRQAFNNFSDPISLGSVRGTRAALPAAGAQISLKADCINYLNVFNPILALDANQYTAGATSWPDQTAAANNFTINAAAFQSNNGINFMNFSSDATGAATVSSGTAVSLKNAATYNSGATLIAFTQIVNKTTDYRTLFRGITATNTQVIVNTGANTLGVYDTIGAAGFIGAGFDVTTIPYGYSNFNMLIFKLQNTSPYFQFKYNSQSATNYYTITASANAALNSDIGYIGGLPTNAAGLRQCWGNVGLVLAYNSLLTEAQINDIYLRFAARFLYNTPAITSGMIGYYTGESWNAAGASWQDLSGLGNHAVTTAGTISVYNSRSADSSAVSYQALNGFKYLGGYASLSSSITFPSAILPTVYTLCWVAKYAGTGISKRIFDATGAATNWFSGFINGTAGVAGHSATSSANYITATADIYGNNWIIGVDQTNLFRTNGIQRSAATYGTGTSGSYNLSINAGAFTATDKSDWFVATVIVYNRELSLAEILNMELWLANKYNLTVYIHPLDKITGAGAAACVGAYGMARLSSAYTGPTFKVRNGTTNALMDFYADANGIIGAALNGTGLALATWLGAATGYIDTWYDQSGVGNHAYQNATGDGVAYQPSIDVINNMISFKTNGGASRLKLPNGTVPYGDASYSVIIKHNTVGTNGGGLLGSGTALTTSATNSFGAYTSAVSGFYNNYWWGNDASTAAATFTAANLVTWKYTIGTGAGGTNRVAFINGTSVTDTVSGTVAARASTNINNFIGYGDTNNANYLNGELYFIYIFNSALSYADQNIIEQTPYYVAPLSNLVVTVSAANVVTNITWTGTTGYHYVVITCAGLGYTSTNVAAGTTAYVPSGWSVTPNASSAFVATPYYYLNKSGTAATAAAGVAVTTAATTVSVSGAPSVTVQPSTVGTASGTTASMNVNWAVTATFTSVLVTGTAGTIGAYGTGTVLVTNLAPNTSYTFTVTPYSGASGGGTAQTTTALYTLATITGTASTSSPTTGSLTLTWPAPVSGNYSTVTITASPVITTISLFSGTTTTISSLSPGTLYTFTITPNNFTTASNYAAAITCTGTTTSTTSASIPVPAAATIANPGFEATATPLVGDPYYSQVALLLRGDGNFADSSTYRATGIVGANVATSASVYLFGIGSLQFPGGTGTASYYYTPQSPAYTLGTNNFTIEFWYNLAAAPASATTNVGLIGNAAQTGATAGTFTTNTWQLYFNGTAGLVFSIYNSSITLAAPAISTPYSVGCWNHVAVVRNGTVLMMFINGILSATTVIVATAAVDSGGIATNVLVVGASGITGKQTLAGYIDDLRVTVGIARYVATFQPAATANPAAVATTTATQCISSDPYGQYVVLLLHGTGIANSSAFTDNSQYNALLTPYGTAGSGLPVIASAGNPITVPTGTPVGTSAVYFSTATSSYTNYIITPQSSTYTFGTQNFTIEFWVYMITLGGTNNGVISNANAAGTYGTWSIYYYSGGYWCYSIPGGQLQNTTFATNTWYHIAATRNGIVFQFYVNGSSAATRNISTTAASFDSTTTNILTIGHMSTGNFSMNGYLADLRVTIGICRYNANFTPPTMTYPNVYRAPQVSQVAAPNGYPYTQSNGDPYYGNVALLVHGTLFDYSKNTAPLYAVGVVASTGVTKNTANSLYFATASNTNIVLTPTSSAYTLGTQNFTIECWVNLTSISGYTVATQGIILANSSTTWPTNTWLLYHHQTQGFIWYPASNGAINNLNTVNINTWYHLAVVRNGSTFTFYINGVSNGTATSSAATDNGTTNYINIGGGLTSTASSMQGYITDVRITVGVARYTANFAVPTTPYANNPVYTASPADPYFGNVTLLLHGDGSFADSSANLAAMTTTGTVTNTGPAKFSTGALGFTGGSSIAYLSTPSSLAYTFGANNFTIECWFNLQYFATYANLFSNGKGTAFGFGNWALYLSAPTSSNYIINGSLEVPAIPTNGSARPNEANGTTYLPLATNWTFTQWCGIISNNGSGGLAYGGNSVLNVAPYIGNQVLWIQYITNLTGTATLAISNLTSGSIYVVNYVFARRIANLYVNHTITVNGTVQKTYQNAIGSENAWTNDSFTFTANATTASMVFTSGTSNASYGDQTLIFDNITISPLNAAGAITLVNYQNSNATDYVTNGGLETPALTPINTITRQADSGGPATLAGATGWTFTNYSGIAANNGAGGNVSSTNTAIPPYSGNQVLWMQYFNSLVGTATNTITNLTPGLTYTVSYMYARRFGSINVNHTVSINGVVVKTYQYAPGFDSAWTNDSFSFVAIGTTAPLVFTSGTMGVNDQTMLFDNITTNGPTTVLAATGITIPPAQWNHLAIVRNGTTVSAYLNGTLYGAAATSVTASIDSGGGTTNTFVVGSAAGASQQSQQNFAGYIDEVRVTMGVARYTANFTPPTAPFPNGIANGALAGWSGTANAGVAAGTPTTAVAIATANASSTAAPLSASTIALPTRLTGWVNPYAFKLGFGGTAVEYPPAAMNADFMTFKNTMTFNTLAATTGLITYGTGIYYVTFSSQAWDGWNAFDKIQTGSGGVSGWASSTATMTTSTTYTGSFSTTISGTAVAGEWLQIQLPNAIVLTSYVIQAGNVSTTWYVTSVPTVWVLAGSNDGIVWYTVDTQSGIAWSSLQTITFYTTNTVSYSYYRIVVQRIGSAAAGFVLIPELRLFGF